MAMIRQIGHFLIWAGFLMPATGVCAAQDHTKYEPTLASLDSYPLPGWYAGAKLGIFIHWGLYSVPGWAPLSHPEHDFTNMDYIKNNPYAEWYLNVMRIPGSPTQAFPIWTVLCAGLGAVVASRTRLYEHGLHQEQPLCGVVPERHAHSGLADAGLSQRTLRCEFQLLRLCSHLQPRVEEVESRRMGKDLPRRRGALCGADDEAPRGLHAMAEHNDESESFDSAERAARGA